MKQHENFMNTRQANEDRINAVLEMGDKLMSQPHYANEKIGQKLAQLRQRRDSNKDRAVVRHEALKDDLLLQKFYQDVVDVSAFLCGIYRKF